MNQDYGQIAFVLFSSFFCTRLLWIEMQLKVFSLVSNTSCLSCQKGEKSIENYCLTNEGGKQNHIIVPSLLLWFCGIFWLKWNKPRTTKFSQPSQLAEVASFFFDKTVDFFVRLKFVLFCGGFVLLFFL